jgi:hypothetical protein
MPWPKGKKQNPESVAKRVASLIRSGARRKKPRVVDGVTIWQCGGCCEWLVDAEFYSDARAPNGLKSHCRKCHSESSIRTRDEDNARMHRRESARRVRAADPERVRAREQGRPKRPSSQKTRARCQLNRAVRSGQIARPDSCEACGASGRIEGHHRDYSKPLDVRWLCSLCHGAEHRGPRVVGFERVEAPRG